MDLESKIDQSVVKERLCCKLDTGVWMARPSHAQSNEIPREARLEGNGSNRQIRLSVGTHFKLIDGWVMCESTSCESSGILYREMQQSDGG